MTTAQINGALQTEGNVTLPEVKVFIGSYEYSLVKMNGMIIGNYTTNGRINRNLPKTFLNYAELSKGYKRLAPFTSEIKSEFDRLAN